MVGSTVLNDDAHISADAAADQPPPKACRPSVQDLVKTFVEALHSGDIGPDDDTVQFYDVDRFLGRLTEVRRYFPPGSLNTVAVKANPTIALLRMAGEAGFGAEVASWGEMALADAAGLDPAAIVFDSPAKTKREIAGALNRPLLLNANSRDELLRIPAMLAGSPSRVGLRVNPTIGSGAIDHTSTATRGSKFGVPIDEATSAIGDYLDQGGRLDALHLHVGSQGMTLDQLVAATSTVFDLFSTMRESIPTLTTIDIGGGLPVAYRSGDVVPSHQDYAAALRESIPGLWADDLSLVTEFGRSVHANNGWVATRIEYVLGGGVAENSTVVTHVGADLFVRAAYRPEIWQHEVFVVTGDGELRTGDAARFNVAGPLCFSGDYIARDVDLPAGVEPGDYLIIRDTGAYTSSMWSVYNSRQMPKSVGYTSDDGFVPLTHRESIATLVERWSDGAVEL